MPVLRILAAITSLVILAACAASNVGATTDTRTTRVGEKNTACLKDTGSRMASGAAGCSAFGRSYSNDDINMTGSTTASGALRLLDPSITVH